MNTRLAPCPFCSCDWEDSVDRAGLGLERDDDLFDEQMYVLCKCGATGPNKNTAEEAIEAWNNRPQPTDLK